MGSDAQVFVPRDRDENAETLTYAFAMGNE